MKAIRLFWSNLKLKIRNKIIEKLIKFRDTKTIKLIDFIKWLIIDNYRSKHEIDKPVHLYGIRCITGMYGHGKTVTMSQLGYELREKYGDKIYICSNYGFALQDFPFTKIEDLTKDYDKCIVYLWDEVQNDFPSTDRVFPKSVRQALTLCRKGHGKLIFWCSQDHNLVHKTIRRLTIEYYKIRTLLHRYTKCKVYIALDYELLTESNDVEKRHEIKPIRTFSFIQTDYVRSLYKSYQVNNGEELIKE